MGYPNITPAPNISHIVLPQYATSDMVHTDDEPLPFGVYADETDFKEGAADQVAYVWAQLGGAVLDIELTPYIVFCTYEDAVLELSSIINTHQVKSVLSSLLGTQRGKFDENGELKNVEGYVAPGTHLELKYPKFDFGYAMRVADAVSSMANVGGDQEMYKVAIPLEPEVQDYDLQQIIEDASEDPESPFYGKFESLGPKTKVLIKNVYYKSPRSMWRFYGYFGGLNVIGNLNTYGMWADDSQFQVVPVWQNRLQAMAFKESMNVRMGNYSYRIVNNKLRLFPMPDGVFPTTIWAEFMFPVDTFSDDGVGASGVNGVNNMSTVPFENIPFEDINSIGKQWIRKYSLAECKKILGGIRSKFSVVPIPNSNVTLNGPSLIAEGKEEMAKLVEDIRKDFDELVYNNLVKKDKELVKDAIETLSAVPFPIYIG